MYWNTVYQVEGHPTWVEENRLFGKALTEALILEDAELEFDILPRFFKPTQAGGAAVSKVELAALTGEEVVFDLYCEPHWFSAHKRAYLWH